MARKMTNSKSVKTNTSKVVKTEEVDLEVTDIEEDNDKKEQVKETPVKKTFDQSDGIMCRSVTQGGLHMEGLKTKMMYDWSEYGDETEVEYRDLVAAVRTKTSFVFNPFFIIEDQDFISEFPQLQKFYNDQYSVKDLKEILELPVNEMIETINTLPNGAKESLKSIASTQVANGRLDSVKKIKALDEVFDTDLNLLSELITE